MRRRKVSVLIDNPVNENGSKLKVWLWVYPSDHWCDGLDEEEDPTNEYDPDEDLEVFQVDEMRGGAWNDISDEWEYSEFRADLEELAQDTYIEAQREKYVEKLGLNGPSWNGGSDADL